MLHEVELLVAGLRPKVLADDDGVVFLRVASFVDEQHALALAERRIGQNHRVFPAPRGREAIVPRVDHYLVTADAVQV